MRRHGFLHIIIIAIALFLVSGISLGAFYLKGQKENKTQQDLAKQPDSTITSESRPAAIVNAFFQAVKNQDKARARSFLSENANREAFKSTLEDASSSPSLYNQEFTFSITESKMGESGNKAFVNLDIVVAGQTLPTLITLEKDKLGLWLISNSETATYGNNNLPFEQQLRQSQRANRVLLLLSGPAEFYLTSPEGTHTGFDPNTKTRVNEIKDTSYRSGGDPKSLTITDLIGTWDLKVIGTGNGKYSIITELVNSLQTAQIDGNASKGSVDTYIVRYPSQTGKALEVTQVK